MKLLSELTSAKENMDGVSATLMGQCRSLMQKHSSDTRAIGKVQQALMEQAQSFDRIAGELKDTSFRLHNSEMHSKENMNARAFWSLRVYLCVSVCAV